MKIELKKFGQMLTSRPAGREAYLAAQAYLLPATVGTIVLDFAGVKVLGPSWADEFLTRLLAEYPGKVTFVNTENASVQATLRILRTAPTA